MDWTQIKSITLSRVCIVVFSVLLAASDIAGYWIVVWFMGFSRFFGGLFDGYFLLSTVYVCSVFAWILLYSMWRLLNNMKSGEVFITENVRYLRRTSWACVAVCVYCLLSTVYYVPFLVVSVAAGFTALIVRIVKNIFEQAISMKDELDFTI